MSRILRALGIAAIMALMTFSQNALAAEAEILFMNNMDIGIKAVFCAGVDDVGHQVAGPVGPQSSAKIELAKVPSADGPYVRVYVLMDSGAGWQFHGIPDFAQIKLFTLDWDGVSAHSEGRYPSLLIDFVADGEEDLTVSPAGIPLVGVKQVLEFGMQKKDWTALATPGYDSLANPGEYNVSFASVSWSLTDKGVTYADEPIGNNVYIAEQVEITAPYSIPTLMAAFDEIKELDARPWLFYSMNSAVAFDGEGKALEPSATLLENMDADDDAPWDALNEQLQKAAGNDDGKAILIVFGTAEVRLELELNLSTSQAVFRITRNAGAAVG